MKNPHCDGSTEISNIDDAQRCNDHDEAVSRQNQAKLETELFPGHVSLKRFAPLNGKEELLLTQINASIAQKEKFEFLPSADGTRLAGIKAFKWCKAFTWKEER